MAKIFETIENRQKEILTIQRFCAAKGGGLDYIKLPRFELDFMLVNEKKIIAFAEVKNYTCNYGDFETVILSKQKKEKLIRYNRLAPAYMLYNFACGAIIYAHLDQLTGKLEYGGRTASRQGAATDKELIYKIPLQNSKIL
jgi:hypothetical protein